MYFNKKYQRTGALFEGPYKSAQIEDDTRLLLLTRHLHHTENHSSYAEYLGKRETLWVQPKVVQSFFEKAKTDLFKGTHSYKDFVENYKLDPKEKELLEGITFDSETEHLEGRDLARNKEIEIHLDSKLKPLQRIPEIAVITVVFLVLVTVGIRNINTSPHKVLGSTAAPAASATPAATLSPSPVVEEEIKPKTMLVITINDAMSSASVNIRQKPTTNSEKIGEANNGDTFEFVSFDSEWYEVKLLDGSTGFISAIYITRDDQ